MQKSNKKNVFNENLFTRNMLNKIRTYETKIIKEAEGDSDAINIPQNDPYFVELKNSILKFVGGVQTDENSLIVYPNDSDVIFNGVITGLNNLKFQFRYNDQSGGLYIWVDSMLLTQDTVDKLGKLVVVKQQFSDYWDENLSNYIK